MGKVVKYTLAVLLGVILTTVYFTPHKAEYLNMLAIRLYMKTDIGRESLRNQLHAECYFGVQRVVLGKDLNVDMLEVEHKICWEQADHTLEFLDQGLTAVGF